jgi:1-phosphatidylinositol-3-phosphate 5-kinase
MLVKLRNSPASISVRSASEHVFTDSTIIVREDEPTSIIAFTLASKTYRDRLRSVGHHRRDTRRTDGTTETSTNAGSVDDAASVLSSGAAPEDTQDTDDTSKREGGTHINYGM